MICNQIIHDNFGHRYRLHFLGDGSIPKHIKPKSFHNETSTRNFLHNMKVSESYWRQLSYQLVGSLPYTTNQRDYLDAIVRQLIQGRIQFFEIKALDTKQLAMEKRTFKQPDGNIYQFVTPTDQLINPTQKTKKFHSKEEAADFVKNLNVEKEDLRELMQTFNLRPPSSNIVNDEQHSLEQSISDALLDEKIVAFVDIPSKPPAPKPVYEDVYIKPVPLAPETKIEQKPSINLLLCQWDAASKSDKAIANASWTLTAPVNESGVTGGSGKVNAEVPVGSSAATLALTLPSRAATLCSAPVSQVVVATDYPKTIQHEQWEDDVTAVSPTANAVITFNFTVVEPSSWDSDEAMIARLKNMGFATTKTEDAVKMYQYLYLKDANGSGKLADIKADLKKRHDGA